MTDLELAYEECRSITRREARNFYYAFLTLPAAQRRAIYVTYAFCRHCDDAVDAEGSNEEKLAMLVSLRSHLSECYQGHAATPVFLALADVAGRYEIPEEYFQEVLSGVQSDLVKDRYEDFEQLRAYCYQVASVVGLICLQIFGYKDSNAKAHAIDLGLAMQLTNIARDVREALEFGRSYLPQDEMPRFGYTAAERPAGALGAGGCKAGREGPSWGAAPSGAPRAT